MPATTPPPFLLPPPSSFFTYAPPSCDNALRHGRFSSILQVRVELLATTEFVRRLRREGLNGLNRMPASAAVLPSPASSRSSGGAVGATGGSNPSSGGGEFRGDGGGIAGRVIRAELKELNRFVGSVGESDQQLVRLETLLHLQCGVDQSNADMDQATSTSALPPPLRLERTCEAARRPKDMCPSL